ncbi:MAG TPA: glycosyltransferase [Puia sp.]|nr:glycosyltransferase [Puia sp.]
MLTIFLFADWYEPGYRAGGPIRSCVNFVNSMQASYRVYVFTRDRDLAATESYAGIVPDTWSGPETGTRVYYCSPGSLTWSRIRQLLQEIKPDFIYLNSMFSTKFTIYPLLISRLTSLETRIVLSPRGMLRASAINFKPLKKRLFLKFFRWSGLQKNISFHASDETEVVDIRRHFGNIPDVIQIPNFPATLSTTPPYIEKKAGSLSIIFIGRIHPIKNLDFLLVSLAAARRKIRLTIVGSIEDAAYWTKCEDLIGRLPDHLGVHYAGELPNRELPALTAAHHLFVLPTRGENFGHAIFEALACGRPVLISDQTPWRELYTAKAGWDLPLGDEAAFTGALDTMAGFNQEEYDAWSGGALRFVKGFVGKMNLTEEYTKLFSQPVP